jgi:hypothetical protein
MSGETVMDVTRVGWLVLAFMMIISRVVFQAAGPAWMRAFLDGWQTGRVKRVWGAASLTFVALLTGAAVSGDRSFSTFDAVLAVMLVVVLLADGLVNVLPAGFTTFKSRLQDAWVRRNRGTGREGDPYLFGVVNALLAVGSIAMAVVVIAYKPIDLALVAGAVGIAVVVTVTLVWASTVESR